jgi:hypothetical protein
MDLQTFTRHLDTDAKCVRYLAAKRWAHGSVCDNG